VKQYTLTFAVQMADTVSDPERLQAFVLGNESVTRRLCLRVNGILIDEGMGILGQRVIVQPDQQQRVLTELSEVRKLRGRIAELNRETEDLRGMLVHEDKRNDHLGNLVADLDGDNDLLTERLGIAKGIIRTGLMWCQQGNLVKAAEDLQRGLDEL